MWAARKPHLHAQLHAGQYPLSECRLVHKRQHPDKTLIGRIARGFDFLGYRFTSDGLAVARQTVERCVAKVSQLDEHGAVAIRIEAYVRHWARAGVTLGNRVVT